jgi:hypothetical protein
MKRLAITVAISGLMFSTGVADAGRLAVRKARKESAKAVIGSYLARKASVQATVGLTLGRKAKRGSGTSGGMRRRGRLHLALAALITPAAASGMGDGRVGLTAALYTLIAGGHYTVSARREQRGEQAKALELALREDVIQKGKRFGSEGVPSGPDVMRTFAALKRRPPLEIRNQIVGQFYGLSKEAIPQGLAAGDRDVARYSDLKRESEVEGEDDPYAEGRAYREQLRESRKASAQSAVSRRAPSPASRREGAAKESRAGRSLKTQRDFDAAFENMMRNMSP